MGTENKQEKGHGVESVCLWLIFGVIVVLSPLICVVLYETILGAEFKYADYAQDVLLIILSLYCNLINLFVDRQKKILKTIRWVVGIILSIAALLCGVVFFTVHVHGVNLNDVFYEKIYISLAVVTVGCAIIGSIIEAISNCKKKES